MHKHSRNTWELQMHMQKDLLSLLRADRHLFDAIYVPNCFHVTATKAALNPPAHADELAKHTKRNRRKSLHDCRNASVLTYTQKLEWQPATTKAHIVQGERRGVGRERSSPVKTRPKTALRSAPLAPFIPAPRRDYSERRLRERWLPPLHRKSVHGANRAGKYARVFPPSRYSYI